MGEFKTAFLINATNQIEADIIKAKLSSFGIESMYKDRETGEFLKVFMGSSPYGVDIFVAENDFEKAYEIVFDNQGMQADSEAEDAVFDEEKAIKEGDYTNSDVIIKTAIIIALVLIAGYIANKLL